MAGETTGEGAQSARHAAELRRLSKQLSTLRPGTESLTVLADRSAKADFATSSPAASRGSAGVAGPGRSALATVLPFRRPGGEAESAQVAGLARQGHSGGKRSAGAPRRQTAAERQERKAATKAAAAEVFATRLEADPEQVARDLCLDWLAVRPHTRAELAAKLKRRAVPIEAIDEVLDRYGEVGLIDDVAYAQTYVESRHAGRGLAKRALAYELRSRGVDAVTAEEAVSQIEPGEEEAKARVLVTRRLATMCHVPSDTKARRLMGMLARKGYPGGMAAAVVRELVAADLDLVNADLED